ncbi:MAG: hypothetical protein U0790_23770 [Isosphaeraceae bacterium]
MATRRELDSLRVVRLREEGPSRGEDFTAAARRAPRGTPRLLGRVVSGGALPGQTDRVFLVNPARIDGVEGEGAVPSIAADASRVVPVVVIGSRVPAVGEPLIALAVGGRWVAESGAAPSSLDCSPCKIPRKDLTVSWVNPILGDGSATLAYSAPGQWDSPCVHGLLYSLSCPGSAVRFDVTYFTSGSCPSGQRQTCSSTGAAPLAIRLAASTCSPFYLRYAVTGSGCPVLASGGYTSFTITE